MVCEYCGSRLAEVPGNGKCPNCDAPVREKAKPVFPEPPIGIYKNRVGENIEITADAVVIRKEPWSSQAKQCVIPYTQLYKVFFKPGNKFWGGWLCIRSWEDRYNQTPDSLRKFSADLTSIIFDPSRMKQFSIINEFLQKCAEIANAAREEK